MRKEERIFNVIADVCDGKEKISWREISNAVTAKMEIKNALTIRGVLGFMLENKLLVRTKDIYATEEYFILNSNMKKWLEGK